MQTKTPVSRGWLWGWLVLALAAAGCAGPRWVARQEDKELEIAAADDSIPSAAEVGLSSAQMSAKSQTAQRSSDAKVR